MYEKAFDTAKKGLEKFPNDAGLLNKCGDLCGVFEKYEEAIEYHKKAIEQNSNIGGSYFSIAFAYKNLEKYEEAIKAWENVRDFCMRKGLDIDAQWADKEIVKLQAIIEGSTE
jgi:tetratricopeptide (TPR) repeat protein